MTEPAAPLAGRRIVVTRPGHQAAPLAGKLAELGAEVAVVPLVEIEEAPLPSDLEVSSYDWVVLTSANGVHACRDLLRAARGVRVAVVGSATAAALEALGITPAFVPERFASDAIADGLGELAGARVLVAQADAAEPELVEALRERGATVDAVVVYRTIARRPSDEERSKLERADVVVLASGSAARALAGSGWRAPDGLLVVCIGPRTAFVAADVGLPPGLVAEEATGEGIIRALVAHFGEST